MTASSLIFADHIARASAWIEDHAPDDIKADLRAIVELRRANGGEPLELWASLSIEIHQHGYLDPACAVCLAGLRADPDFHFLRLRLAELHLLSGDKSAARVALSKLPLVPPFRAPMASMLLRNDMVPETAARNELITGWSNDLLNEAEWSEAHSKLIAYLRKAGLIDFAVKLLSTWINARGANLDVMVCLGQIMLEEGHPDQARHIFTGLWQRFADEFRPIAGDFSGEIAPCDDAVLSRIAEKIDAAFAAAEAPPYPLFQGKPLDQLRDKSIVYVGIEKVNHVFPNDMAAHFQGSAAQAGLRMDMYLDSGLVFPYEFRGDDAEIARRIDRFVRYLDETRPDVVFLDACYFPQKRGLNPKNMKALQDRFGFKLICMMRDALEGCAPIVEQWAPICDTMIVHDPLAPAVDMLPAPVHDKVICLPVPTFYHVAETADVPHDLGLTFVGSVNFRMRLMFLSVLMTAGIDFTALFGESRAAQTPDLRSYFHWLARSKAILNFSAHSGSEHLITGRVWETLTVGAVLLEQRNDNTACMLQPWRHYLPWSSVQDIIDLWRLLERRDDLRAKIAAAGQDYALRHYNSEKIWSAIMAHAYRAE